MITPKSRRWLVSLFLFLFLVSSLVALPVAAQDDLILSCSDVNADEGVDISDASYLLSFLFLGGLPPNCPVVIGECGNVNGDSDIDISDAVYLLSWLFLGGPAPVCGDNAPPTADAGPDRQVEVDQVTSLDGSTSSDPDGEALMFAWTQLSAPEGSLAELSDPAAIVAEFVPDLAGIYSFGLVVNDGQADSAQDTVTITATEVGSPGDSDGNGIPDEVEIGPVPAFPLDTDRDEIPDYLDRDDDGDGVLDVHDEDRLVPVATSNLFDQSSRVFLLAVRTEFGPEQEALNVARAGDELVLEGDGFSTEPSDNVIVFEGSAQPLNVFPRLASETELRVTVPDGARSPVFVVTENRRSNEVALSVLRAGAPVILSLDPRSPSRGELLTITGVSLNRVERLLFDVDLSAEPLDIAPNQLLVEVPVGAVAGDLVAISASTRSNSLFLPIGLVVPFEVAASPGIAEIITKLEVFGGTEVASIPDVAGRGELRINGSGLGLVGVALPGDPDRFPTPVYIAATLPADTLTRLGPLSTAVAMLLATSDVIGEVDLDRLATVREDLGLLPAVVALADAIAQGQEDDSQFLSEPGDAFWLLFDDALGAGELILDTPLADGGAGAGGLPDAEAADVAMILPESEQFDVLVEQIEGSGNLHLENDSMLYLSVQMRDVATGGVIQRHIVDYFDREMIGVQSGLKWLFDAKSKDYSVPNYRDTLVEVVTAGFLLPQPGTAVGIDAQLYLRLRTYIERIFLPVIVQAAGMFTNEFKKSGAISDLSAAIIKQMMSRSASGDDVRNMRSVLLEGDVGAILSLISKVLIEDIKGRGPIVNLIAKAAFVGVAPEALNRAVAGLVAKLLPIYNILDAGLSAIESIDKVVSISKTVVDLQLTPGRLDFDVLFGDFNVFRVTNEDGQPVIVRAAIPAILDIQGFGLRPRIPEAPLTVHVTDLGGGEFREINTDDNPDLIEISISFADGRRMAVALSSVYVQSAQGPLEVRVTKGKDEAIAPNTIEVRGEIEISRITNWSASPGDTITIDGSGFIQEGDDELPPELTPVIKVDFIELDPENPNSPDITTRTDPVEVAVDHLTVVVPDLPADEWRYRVVVERRTGGRRVISNGLNFYTEVRPPLGFWRITSERFRYEIEINGRTIEKFTRVNRTMALLPNGTVADTGQFFSNGSWAKIGTWSASGDQVKITGCSIEELIARNPFQGNFTFVFNGTLDLTGTGVQSCCDDVTVPCDDVEPCPALAGTFDVTILGVTDPIQIIEVPGVPGDTAYLANVSSPRFRRGWVGPLAPTFAGYDCIGACYVLWTTRPCRCAAFCPK